MLVDMTDPCITRLSLHPPCVSLRYAASMADKDSPLMSEQQTATAFRRMMLPGTDSPLRKTASALKAETTRVQKKEAEALCTSQVWLRRGHGLVPQGLRPENVANAAAFKLPELATKLDDTLAMYEWRAKWLASGSRCTFPVVAERNIAVLVDTTFDDPRKIIQVLERAAEDQLGVSIKRL